jgi:hypothetical protein
MMPSARRIAPLDPAERRRIALRDVLKRREHEALGPAARATWLPRRHTAPPSSARDPTAAQQRDQRRPYSMSCTGSEARAPAITEHGLLAWARIVCQAKSP